MLNYCASCMVKQTNLVKEKTYKQFNFVKLDDITFVQINDTLLFHLNNNKEHTLFYMTLTFTTGH